MNGKKVGVALGAGGGRGIAHIGVLQALEDNRIPIDLMSGCSIGSIIGAIYTAGTDLKLLTKFCMTLSSKNIIDPTNFARGGILAGDKLEELVRVLSHDLTFDRTRIPFWCTAVDLESGEQVIFHEGKLHSAARASMAIPGVFVPVSLNGRYLVDGGCIEEIPAQVLHDNGADVVIAVDISDRDYRIKGTPTVIGSIMRASEIMQQQLTDIRVQPIDVRIKPYVGFMGTLSTDGTERAVEEGYRAAMEQMPRIRELLGM